MTVDRSRDEQRHSVAVALRMVAPADRCGPAGRAAGGRAGPAGQRARRRGSRAVPAGGGGRCVRCCPAACLRRGSTVAVGSARRRPCDGSGATSLLFALLAEASAAGSWCAVVGLPRLGLVAAAEAGVAVDRLALVPHPGPDWVGVVARPARRGRHRRRRHARAGVPRQLASRLAARARQRGAVLIAGRARGPVPTSPSRSSAAPGTAWVRAGAGCAAGRWRSSPTAGAPRPGPAGRACGCPATARSERPPSTPTGDPRPSPTSTDARSGSRPELRLAPELLDRPELAPSWTGGRACGR